MNPAVDDYIANSHMWPDEIAALRPVLLDVGLTEEVKWRKPCYSHRGKNIAIVQEMKDFLALMFFKGALLQDSAGLLRDQGPNSRSARRFELTSVEEVIRLAPTISSYLEQAKSIEEEGRALEPTPALVLVAELQRRLDADRQLKSAFEALTPGRQREYNLHISGAKQAKTREARIEKYASQILSGKGLRDR